MIKKSWILAVIVLISFCTLSIYRLKFQVNYISASENSSFRNNVSTLQVIYSDQFTIYSPYSEEDFQFKGQIHCHTQASDGNDTPQEIMEAYRSLGYQFVAITDHDSVTKDPGVPGILFISGVEESSSSGHILGIGVKSQTDEIHPDKVIDYTQEKGIAIYAHPNRWSFSNGWFLKELLSAPGARGIEAINPRRWRTNSENKWDALLTRGYQIWGAAGDDCHSITQDINQAWIVVAAPYLSEDNIITALRNGNFYSTEGPDLSVKVYSDRIVACTSTKATIKWITKGGIKSKVISGVTEDSYFIKGDEGYIRVAIIRDKDEKKALGQPVFIE